MRALACLTCLEKLLDHERRAHGQPHELDAHASGALRMLGRRRLPDPPHFAVGCYRSRPTRDREVERYALSDLGQVLRCNEHTAGANVLGDGGVRAEVHFDVDG